MAALRVRHLTSDDRAIFARLVTETWGATRMATRGRLVDVADLPGLVAEEGGTWSGHLADAAGPR